jgi:hypothetical protein
MQDVSGVVPLLAAAGGFVPSAGVHAIVIDGGNGVTVTSLGQNVTVGANFGTAGAQSVTQTGILTGAGLGKGNGTVVVDGGAAVTIVTTGGAVTVGSVNFQPTGPVTITDSFGSGNATADAIAVMGGTDVKITVSSAETAAGFISVGSVGTGVVLNAAKTAVANANLDPIGNVTIVDDQVNGSTTTYGKGAVNVITNGGAAVSITGGASGAIVDAESTLGTGLGGPGTAVGKSALATVSLIGNQSAAAAIQTDALTNLTIQNSILSTYTVTDNTPGYTLGLTLGGDTKGITVIDAGAAGAGAAGAVTITDNGSSSVGAVSVPVTITAPLAKTLTATTTAAINLALGGDTALTTITAANTAALGLGDVTGLAKLTAINAGATATGSIKVSLDDSVTSFNGTGSTGAETVGIKFNVVGTATNTVNIVAGVPGIVAGVQGVNTLVLNYDALAADTPIGNNTHVKGFTALALGTVQSDAHTGTVYKPTVTAVTQVDTETVGAVVPGNTYTISINGGPATPTVTAGALDTPASIAGKLAGALITQGNAGVNVGYTAGATSLTITSTVAGTGFTVANGGTGALTDTPTVPNTPASAGDAAYDASGFSALSVGGSKGDVTFINVAGGATLAIGAPDPAGGATLFPGQGLGGAVPAVVNYLLAKPTAASSLAVTVGVDGTATGAVNAAVAPVTAVTAPGTGTTGNSAAFPVTIATTGIPIVSIASLGEVKSATGVTQTNFVTLADTAAGAIAITGDQALTLTLKTDGLGLLGGGGAVGTIDASAAKAAVDVSAVPLSEPASGGTHTISGGGGALTAVGGTSQLDADTFNVGAGGGTITLGSGGKWFQTPAQIAGSLPGSYSSGSETVSLTAVNATTPVVKATTLKVADGAVSTQATSGGATVGGVSNFANTITNADVLSYLAPKTLLANVGVKTPLSSVAGFATMATVLGFGVGSTALADLKNLSYTVFDGVISFDTAAGGTLLSSYTTQELVSAAEMILNGTGASLLGGFTQGSNTFVVSDDALQTLSLVLGANLDSVTELVGVSGVTGFGTTGAANSVDVKGVTFIDATPANVTGGDTGTGGAHVFNAAGFSQTTISAAAGKVPVVASAATEHGKVSYTFNNLASSAIVNIDSGSGATPFVGDLVVNQFGTAGSMSLTVNIGSAGSPTIVDSLTIAGDAALTLNSPFAASAVTTLVDSGSLATLTIGGAAAFAVDGITSTSLAAINVTNTGGAVTLFDQAAFANVVTITDTGSTTLGISGGPLKIGTSIGANQFGLTGTGDTVSIGTASLNNSFANEVHLSGSKGVITIDGTGANIIVASGSNDQITVGDTVNGIGGNTITATGTGNTVTLLGEPTAAVTVTVGNSAIINFSSDAKHPLVAENVILTGDTTGGTSASFLQTTINHAADAAGQTITFGNSGAGGALLTEALAGATVASSMVNVSSAADLPHALDLAAAQAALAVNPNPNTTTFGQIPGTTTIPAGPNGVIDWFQFGGNTYIVEAVNSGTTAAPHTALGAQDAVVELVGLVNIGVGGSFAAGTHILTL